MNESTSMWRITFSEVWRLTHLCAEESGPRELIVCLSASFAERLMNCFYCLSLWFSHPLAIWLSTGWVGLLLHWQALSGPSCLVDKITRRLELNFRNAKSRGRYIMCCGEKRNELESDQAAGFTVVKLLYCGRETAQFRGSGTGELYHFSPINPIQHVDARDTTALMQTCLFRHMSIR